MGLVYILICGKMFPSYRLYTRNMYVYIPILEYLLQDTIMRKVEI